VELLTASICLKVDGDQWKPEKRVAPGEELRNQNDENRRNDNEYIVFLNGSIEWLNLMGHSHSLTKAIDILPLCHFHDSRHSDSLVIKVESYSHEAKRGDSVTRK
jgi:hypothetical protein